MQFSAGCRFGRLVLPVVLLVATGCASGGGGAAPSTTAIPAANRGFDGGTQFRDGFTNAVSSVQDSVIPESRARVWEALPGVFRTLGVETPTVNRYAFTMGNPGSRVARLEGSTRLSRFFDCGIGILGPNADTYEVTLQLLVQLATDASGGTLVRTTVDAYARPRSSSGDPIHCASQRTLERRIPELISQAIGASGTESSEASGQGFARGASAELPPMSPGRLPTAGDHVRLQCLAGPGSPLVGEGRYLGSGNGGVQLLLDARGNAVSVPAPRVMNVEIRERRSYARMGGIIGVLLGAAGGAYYGASYEEENPKRPKFHYGKEVFISVGGVAGALGGLLVGRITGSFFKSDTWHQAPPEWAIRSSGVTAGPTTQPPACPDF